MLIKSDVMAVGFVVFNEPANFSSRVKVLTDLGLKVYVYDNSPSSLLARSYISDKNSENISYFTSGKNVGLGIAMSTLCAQAYYDGFESLFFLDQDTVFTKETIYYMKDLFLKESVLLKEYSVLTISDKDKNPKLKKGLEKKISDVLLVRNSGSLFFLKNLSIMGWFDESFFVDGVDYEFSLRSSLNNLLMGAIHDVPGFNHFEEQGYSKFNFFGYLIENRKYGVERLVDILVSTIRLLYRSIMNFKFKYFLLFVKNIVVFMATQLIIRLSRKIK